MSRKHETKAKIKEVAGSVTGDRRVEAEGRAEGKSPDGHVPAERVDRELETVRKEHHDVSDR